MLRSRLAPLMLFLALAVPTAVLAQDTADLHGVVLDASGKPVAGYPMSLVTTQWGPVILQPTDDDGTFGVTGLPPGTYEIRVFQPGGSTDNPIASEPITVAAGQKEQIEIRLNSNDPGGTAASKSEANPVAGVNRTVIAIAALVLVAALVVFFVRSRRSSGG